MKKALALVLALMLLIPAFSVASAEEPIVVKWVTVCPSDTPDDTAKVVEAANAYSAEKYGFVVDFELMDETTLQQYIEVGNPWDVSYAKNFDTFARYGYYAELTDLLEYVPELAEFIDQKYWDCCVVEWMDEDEEEWVSGLYGVPTLKDLGRHCCFRIHAGYYEDVLGMELPYTMKFEELEPYLAAFKADRPDEYPIPISRGGLSHWYSFMECLAGSNSYKLISIPYYYAGTEKGTTALAWYEVPEYVERIKTLHKWYDLGYIAPDGAITETLPGTIPASVRAGAAWEGYTGWSSMGPLTNIKLVWFDGPFMSRSTMGERTVINAGSDEAHQIAGLKLIQALNVDPTYRNFFAYGLEGEHYEFLDNGTVYRTSDRYDTTGWLYTTGCVISAAVESSVDEEGNIVELADPNLWTTVFAGYEKAAVSDLYSFSFNTEAVEDELAACEAIMAKYQYDINCGSFDVDEQLDGVIAELKAAGIDEVKAEVQRQIDEYLARQASYAAAE